MLRNYLVTAFNVLLRNPVYSLINIFGLAVGIAACLLIAMFVQDELSHDSFWPDGENIYRVQATYAVTGRDPIESIRAVAKYKHWMDKDLVGAEAVGRLRRLEGVIRKDGEAFSDFVSFIDPEFLEIFPLEPIAGDYLSALDDKAALVITKSFAEKYFGDGPAVGRVLTVSVYQLVRDYKVVAVVDDPPRNSQFVWRAFAFVNEPDFVNQTWEYSADYSLNNLLYVKAQPGVSGESIARQMPDILDNNSPRIIVNGQPVPPSKNVIVRVVNIGDTHLHGGGGDWGTRPAGDIRVVYGLLAIGVLITLIAAINFINLTTARSTRRAREVSLRKVVGAYRGQLVVQYVGESIFLCLLSLAFACVITAALLPWFNSFTGKELSLLSSSIPLAIGLLVALLLGIFGGLYPALYISRFQPASVLRANKSSETAGSGRLRTALVVVQFAISIGLVICTTVIYSQTIYARNADLGYHKRGMLIVYDLWNYSVVSHAETLVNEVKRLPGVISVGRSDRTPGGGQGLAPVTIPGDTTGDDFYYFNDFFVDEKFLGTYGIGITSGRDFHRDRISDAVPADLDAVPEHARVAAVIINQAAIDLLQFGSPFDAIGRQMRMSMSPKAVGPPHVLLTVIGTVPDVHFNSLRDPIAPAMFVLNKRADDLGHMTIRFDPEVADMPAALESTWKRLIPDIPVKYQFLDELWDAQYSGDERQAETLAVFAGLAIIIACLGLFGLSSFTAELRTKEIGIRKVMGAKTGNIIRLLATEFSKPILLANVIAWPAAWYAMSQWLSQFHYRIDLALSYFLLPSVIAFAIALGTLFVHIYRVASAHPIEALRYE